MRIAPSESSATRRTGRTEAVILFLVSGQMFAISASAIHEIRSTDSLSGTAIETAHPEVPKVRHRLRRGQKKYYVVNGCAHFGLPALRPTLVLILRSAPVALLVDRIDRMEAMSLLMALPHAFCGAERNWYRGVTLMDEEVVPVLNPSGFLTQQELSLLDAATAASDTARNQSAPAADQASATVHGAASQ
jgi:chemotaxis signal transduction protein